MTIAAVWHQGPYANEQVNWLHASSGSLALTSRTQRLRARAFETTKSLIAAGRRADNSSEW